MAYGDIYTLRHTAAVSTAITLAQIHAGAAVPVEILEASITAVAPTSASLLLIPAFIRKSTGATVTAAVLGTHLFENQGAGAPDPSVQLGTSGTGVVASAEGVNTDVFQPAGMHPLSGGWSWVRIADGQLIIPGGGKMGLTLLQAPTNLTYYWSITFKELG